MAPPETGQRCRGEGWMAASPKRAEQTTQAHARVGDPGRAVQETWQMSSDPTRPPDGEQSCHVMRATLQLELASGIDRQRGVRSPRSWARVVSLVGQLCRRLLLAFAGGAMGLLFASFFLGMAARSALIGG